MRLDRRGQGGGGEPPSAALLPLLPALPKGPWGWPQPPASFPQGLAPSSSPLCAMAVRWWTRRHRRCEDPHTPAPTRLLPGARCRPMSRARRRMWLKHCNNTPPPPSTTYQWTSSNPPESEKVLGQGASITTTNCPCSCVPSLPGPGLRREQARVHFALEQGG